MAKKEGLTTEEFEKLLKNELDLTITDEEKEEKEEQENTEELVEGTDTEEKEIEEIKPVDVDKSIDYKGRGFKTLEDAINFPNTETFKRLGNADKEEYLNWLKK